MDEIIKAVKELSIPEPAKTFLMLLAYIVYIVILVSPIIKAIWKLITSRRSYQKEEYPFGDNRLLDRLRHMQELVDSESAIRTRSNQQCKKLNRTELTLFARGFGLCLLFSLFGIGFWLEYLSTMGANMQDALPLCGIVIVLFCATALMEFDDRALNGTIGSVVEIGFWMFMLCMTVFTQIVVLILLMPVTTERLLTAIVQNLFAIVIPTSVLAFPLVSALMSGPNLFFVLIALIFEAISIIIWHMFIRSYYDVRPFKAGFFFTQTGFQSLLSAGNHRRRVQEVCHKESWKTESGLLYEQRLLYPYQFNVIDSFRWEGRGVHFLDATIGRPPWQNPEWHFQQAAHLERMSDKRDEENLKHKYAQPRRTKEFVNLCRSVMQLPIHLDDIEAETPNDAHTIARHVEEYLKKYSPRKNDYILCFSHNGISSMLVTLRLLQLGYKHTYDLGECAIRYPLINVKAQELTMLSMLAQEEAPGEILVPGYPSIRTH